MSHQGTRERDSESPVCGNFPWPDIKREINGEHFIFRLHRWSVETKGVEGRGE